MKANYHTHTSRCKHASGTEEEYIQKAISEGIEILGFSDHAPHAFEGGYISPCRMELSETDNYFETLLDLKERYKDYIELHIGFEIEYYPLLWDKTIECYKKYPLEYLILGEHFVGNESVSCQSAFATTSDKDLLSSYVDYCIDAINTHRITYIAHPDCMNFVGDEETYVNEMSRLISEANKYNLPLEINIQGMRDNRTYPRELFWQTASRLGATAVFGCDCHEISHVADKKEIENAKRYADKLKINVIDKVNLINPIF